MKIAEYSRDFAHQALDKWRKSSEIPEIDAEFALIRSDMLQKYNSIKKGIVGETKKEYLIDVLFGLYLYDYLNQKPWFNLRTAANDGFWRYIAVSVIPDIVADRWGTNNDNYFWKQSNRLWPKTAWWYIHLSWHESLEQTKDILISANLNSDIIQGIVERTGKKGTFIEVYREIVFQYSRLDTSIIVKFKKQLSLGSDSLFRAVMKLNTAKGLVTDPCLYEGGIEGYVKSLFIDLISKLQ